MNHALVTSGAAVFPAVAATSETTTAGGFGGAGPATARVGLCVDHLFGVEV